MLPLANIAQTVVTAFSSSDFIGKFIVIVQGCASIYAIAFWISHKITLDRVRSQTEDFRRYFAKNRSVVDYFFTHAPYNNPILRIYFTATERLLGEIGAQTGATPRNTAETAGQRLQQSSFDLVKGVAEEALAIQNHRIENGMSLLGAVATIAPFMGLLGTVIGVMEAFQDMGQQGAVNLATVAPYLSTAMLTTVVGLVVAIPAVIGYNVLSRRIGEIQIQFDGFTDEYLGRVGTEFCGGGN